MACQFAAWAAGVTLAERLVALVKSIFGRKPKDPPGPTAKAPTGTGQVDSGKPTTLTESPRPPCYRQRPAALLGLTVAWLALWWCVGCSTVAFEAKTLPELAALCEQIVPCEACPPASTPAPTPVDPGGGTSPPTPEPGNQAPPPDAGSPGAGVDAVDPGAVTWLHASPADFRVTAQLSEVRLQGRTLSWSWRHPPWPEWRSSPREPWVVGNLWVLGLIRGRWYGSTLEWLRTDTVRTDLQGGEAAPIFVQAKRSPIDEWRPGPGERVCWMVSTITRAGIQPASSPRERSPIVCSSLL